MEELIKEQTKRTEGMLIKLEQQEKEFADERLNWMTERTNLVNEIEATKNAQIIAFDIFESRLKIVELKLGIGAARSEDVDTHSTEIKVECEHRDKGKSIENDSLKVFVV